MSRPISRRRRVPWWIRRAVRLWARCAGGGGRAAGAAACGAAPLADERPATPPDERRCGWFDSSLDLRQGLAVSEHEPGDAAVEAQLPVVAWVQLQLCGWQPRVQGEAVPP
jgi:hypothetical protein